VLRERCSRSRAIVAPAQVADPAQFAAPAQVFLQVWVFVVRGVRLQMVQGGL